MKKLILLTTIIITSLASHAGLWISCQSGVCTTFEVNSNGVIDYSTVQVIGGCTGQWVGQLTVAPPNTCGNPLPCDEAVSLKIKENYVIEGPTIDLPKGQLLELQKLVTQTLEMGSQIILDPTILGEDLSFHISGL